MPDVAERIAVSDSGYEFPVEDILTGRGAVFGKSGSGKSNTATVVAEELLDQGVPLLIVDQDGEYYGLAEEYDHVQHYGAGPDCDRQVGAEDGEMVADVALEENTPIVLDVSGFMEEATARELVHAVVRRLFQRENEVRKPFLLVVEEVHEYIPEQGGLDDLGEMLIRVAKRGRKRGLGICGISQRPASVDKDFITQCDWIVWHRLTWNNDTKVVGRILGSEYADTVQDLGNGEAYVMSDWAEDVEQVRFRLKRSADAGATPGLDQFRDDAGTAGGGGGGSGSADQGGGSPGSDAEGATDTQLYDGPDAGEMVEMDGVAAGSAGGPAGGADDASEGAADPLGPAGGRKAESSTGGEDQADRRNTPPVPEDDEMLRGNPVWEFGQLVFYLFALVFYTARRVVRALLPGRSASDQRADPLAGSGPGRANKRGVAIALLLLGLAVGAGVYFFVLS